jgi:UDP-N-acetylglucosamine 2-epimerase (non-hydrolysing)
MPKVINVIGARPNYIKIAPLHAAMRQDGFFQPCLIHTGQHYGAAMSDVFFQQLGLPDPDYALKVGSGSHARQTAEIMVRFEDVVQREKPDLVVVVGDVNSTLAAALVAVKMGVRVAHVEAGLRSRDLTMPEEHNRKVTDHLSQLLFTSCPDADENLLREGIGRECIFFVGNIMIDSLVQHRDAINASRLGAVLGLQPQAYALLTLHRPGNVDTRESLEKQVALIDMVQRRIPLVFPVHPRTEKLMIEHGLLAKLAAMRNLIKLDPVGYVDFISLIMHARLVLTDSGGVQEETTFLQVPCLTLRDNTERPVTITAGTNVLTGTDPQRVEIELQNVLNGRAGTGRVPELWDGRTTERIIAILKKQLA